MPVGTVDPTISTDLNVLWRKVQTGVYQGLNYEVEEYDHLMSLKKFGVNMSTREITVPIDIQRGFGAASIAEDGHEAFPSSPNGRELSLSWVDFNKRFTFTRRARWIQQYSKKAMLEDQFKYQAAKAMQALAAHVGDYMYGYSTAYLAQVDDGGGSLSAGTSHTLPLKNGYGDADITDAAYISRLFVVGDRVALVSGGALVTNATGTITAASSSTPSITVDWDSGSSVDPDDGDYVVKSNSMQTQVLAGTDYNRGLPGFLDMYKSASLHGLATATEPEWAAAVNNSDGGRLTGIDIHYADQEIRNWGGGRLTDAWIAQGVHRDLIAQNQAAVRFSSPMGMEVDGDVKRKGTTFHSSRRTPPGMFMGYDKSAIAKLSLLSGKPDEPLWDDGEKLENRPIWAFGIDLPLGLVCLNRRKLALFTGRTEQ